MRIEIAGPGETINTPIGVGLIEDYEIMPWRSKPYVRYLYSNLMDLLVEDMRRNIADHYDNLAVVEGGEGSGKSNFTLQLLRSFYPDFDIEKSYMYDMDDWKNKLRQGDDVGGAFWMDEGSNMANNREWATEDSRNVVAMLEMMRSRGWTMVWDIPTHQRLDIYIREHRMRYLIQCAPMEFELGGYKRRGYWELKKRSDYGNMITIGYGKFDPMSEADSVVYERIKRQSQNTKIREVVDDKSPGAKYKAMYEKTSMERDDILFKLYSAGRISRDEVAELAGIANEQTLANRLSK